MSLPDFSPRIPLGTFSILLRFQRFQRSSPVRIKCKPFRQSKLLNHDKKIKSLYMGQISTLETL